MTINFIKEENKSQILLKMGSALTFNEVHTLQDEILSSLSSTKTLILDLYEVKDCDEKGVQLIYAFLNLAKYIEKEILLTGITSCIKDVAAQLELSLK